MLLHIYDIDQTLVCSKHRQLTLPDGTLNLEHWRENSTPEKIMQDRLLPFGHDVARYLSTRPTGLHVACTARVMIRADYAMLEHYGLIFDKVLSRPANCADSDIDLKEWLLRDFAKARGISFRRLMKTARFWDDNSRIRAHFANYGTQCYDPVPYNATREIHHA